LSISKLLSEPSAPREARVQLEVGAPIGREDVVARVIVDDEAQLADRAVERARRHVARDRPLEAAEKRALRLLPDDEARDREQRDHER
jgi:hypothetical protein